MTRHFYCCVPSALKNGRFEEFLPNSFKFWIYEYIFWPKSNWSKNKISIYRYKNYRASFLKAAWTIAKFCYLEKLTLLMVVRFLGSSQLTLLPLLPLKTMLDLKGVKIGSKIIINSIHYTKSEICVIKKKQQIPWVL